MNSLWGRIPARGAACFVNLLLLRAMGDVGSWSSVGVGCCCKVLGMLSSKLFVEVSGNCSGEAEVIGDLL